MQAKLLITDINGTLTRPKEGRQWPIDGKDAEAIEGMQEAIARYASDGYICVGASNQGGVGAGHRSLNTAIEEMQTTLELFPELRFILICTDYPGIDCYIVDRDAWRRMEYEPSQHFRKPYGGMVEAACMVLGVSTIDFKNSVFMGDRLEDYGCAAVAGIPFKPAGDYIEKHGEPIAIVPGTGTIVV